MVETRRTFDEQLQEVRAEVVKLAVQSCEQIGAATQALLDADLALVDQIYAAHREIEERVLQIEHRVYQLFALQQPMASDLRAMLAVLRILHEIELTGGPDAQRRPGRPAASIPASSRPGSAGIIERMGAQASVQMHLAVDAFADGDETIASALPDMDDVMDDLQKELFRAIFAGFSGESADEAALQMAVQLAFVGPRLRTRRRPRGDDRALGRVHGHRPAPGRRRRTHSLRSPTPHR